jgi:hypothetical protein
VGEGEPKDEPNDEGRGSDAARQQQPGEHVDSRGWVSSCPDCACTDLAVISDGQFVTVYKCPRCGKLLAPVKQR